jgi:hypothetical protein
MGAFCAGSYKVTPPGRSRATTSSAGPTDRPKDSTSRQAYGESDPADDVSHILTGLRVGVDGRGVGALDALFGGSMESLPQPRGRMAR